MNATSPTVLQAPAFDTHPERAPLRRAELLLIFAFWTLIAILSSANTFLDPRGRGGMTAFASAPIIFAFVDAYLWAAITPGIFWVASRHAIERSNWTSRVLLFLGIGLLVAITVDWITDAVRFQLFNASRQLAQDVAPVVRVRRLWFMNEFIVYVAITAAGFARNYFLRYRARREEAINLQAQAAHLQAQLADARLAALRTQLNPHFLFNTLHAISALVERDPRGVRRMIARLSELLRAALDADEQEIPLRQELTFTERYLEIMQIRFQGHLQVEMQIAPEVQDALVPNFVLQPLVENAVRHGVGNIEGIGRIEISAKRDGERVVLTLKDNGAGFPAHTAPSEGVGLSNTRARLLQLYGPAQSLTLRAAEGGGVLAEVTLPYHTRTELHTAAVIGDA